MNTTKIPWVKNPDGMPGYTVNPFTGCFNGCTYCYANQESKGRCHQQDLKGQILDTPFARVQSYLPPRDSFFPRIHLNRFVQLEKAPRNAGIFVCDRSDWAADYWPENLQRRIIGAAVARPDIRLYLLTKQPQNLIKFSPFPENCWVGVTATGNKMADIAQRHILKIEAKVKFLSIEPFLEHIQWEFILGYNQVILGCQTKPIKLPERAAVDEIITACDKAGIPVFVKPPLSEIFNIHLQEMPK